MINRWWNVIHTSNEIYLNMKWSTDMCYNADEPWQHASESHQSQNTFVSICVKWLG